MIIILDFDHTLFNTEEFKNSHPGIEIAKTFLWKKGDLTKFIFEDTISFLEEHKEHNLVLMTAGMKLFQRAKVEGSDISHYFDKLIFTGDELKGGVIKRLISDGYYNDPIVFVDDAPYQLESVSNFCPIVTVVRIKRPEQPYSIDDGYNSSYEVENMKELKAFLQTL